VDHRAPERAPDAQFPQPRRQDEQLWRPPSERRNPSPLITNRFEAGWRKLPRIDAHCTYVLAYGGGELVAFDRMPRFGDRAGSVRCYVVDAAPRPAHGTMRIRARGDRYAFDATYHARWRVTDPVRVVRANVYDGDSTVDGFMRNRLGSIGRQFDPDDAAGVEMQIHDALSVPAEVEANGLPVGDGLALIALAVAVTPDPRVTDRGVALDDDVHEGTLAERRTMRLRYLLDGDGSAILYHLAQNPTDTATVLQMITDAKDKSERWRLEWLDRMRADDAIQEADYEHARAVVLGGGAAPPALDAGSFRPISSTPPPMIDTGGSAMPQPRPDNPFPTYEPPPAPAPRAAEEPPPFDTNPFGATADGPDAPSFTKRPTPTGRPAEPAAPARPARPAPRAPRDVRAHRLKGGSVAIQWRDVGDVEYRVRRLDDGRWHKVATTTDTFVEDSEAPPGEVHVYSVSAAKDGARSDETRSDA
jgi:hypothetical protein